MTMLSVKWPVGFSPHFFFFTSIVEEFNEDKTEGNVWVTIFKIPTRVADMTIPHFGSTLFFLFF